MGVTIDHLSQEISKSKEYTDSKFSTVLRDIQDIKQHSTAEISKLSLTVGALQSKLMSRSPDHTSPAVPASDDVRSETVLQVDSATNTAGSNALSSMNGVNGCKIKTDDRMISAEQLRAKVCEGNRLSTGQQEDLYKMLAKYQQHLTKRPGKCTQFEYEFRIEGSMPHSANSRPIPFALRPQVREQIRAMLQDGILEESHSAYINQITLVVREGKAVRICLDAR
jgi:hypothetical protein